MKKQGAGAGSLFLSQKVLQFCGFLKCILLDVKRPIIIGIDHGYGNIKTANCCFKTGVASFDKEPTFKSNLLLFEGRYYLIGEEHKEFTADKMADSDYYILTLAAIGRELNIRKQTSARVHLAAGLPLTWVSEQKDAFKKYLLQKGSADFTFRGVEYHVDFAGADIFPQGFAAVADQLRDFRGVNMLADIGNGTMNVMYINDRRPQEKKCFTEKYGTHQCMLSVRENLLKLYGSAADVALQIEYAKQERPGSPGRSAFPGPKGALTHHPQAGGGTAFGSRALSEGDAAPAGACRE